MMDHQVKGFFFNCDRCGEEIIGVVRWHCRQCCDYDLCDFCYKQGHHPLTHIFYKITKQGDIRSVKPRLNGTSTGTKWFCDGCMADNREVRWHCALCFQYDLCTKCYSNGEHDMSHPFEKITSTSKTLEPPRTQCPGSGATALISELCLADNVDNPTIELEILSTTHAEYCMVENVIKTTKVKVYKKGILFSPNFHILEVNKVRNIILWKKYRECRNAIMNENNGEANEMSLFHGSPYADKIIKNGFDEKRGNKGMFGYGIYFASNSTKSNIYVYGCNKGCTAHSNLFCKSCTRQMLLCRVTLGKCIVSPERNVFPDPALGFNSVMGKKGKTYGLMQDEFVIYRGEQAYPTYVIKYNLI